MTTFELEQLLATGELLPLIKAAELTPYTAEYLGLLARKKRISALKVNRDWLVTRQEILNYVKSQRRKTASSLKSLQQAERKLEIFATS